VLPRIWSGLGDLPLTLFNRHDVIISITGSDEVEQVGPWKLANGGFSGTFCMLRSIPTDVPCLTQLFTEGCTSPDVEGSIGLAFVTS
jgi:hypothetical protein